MKDAPRTKSASIEEISALKKRIKELEELEGKHIQIEKKLRESENRYQNIIENSVEGIFRTSPEGRFIYANPAAALMLGYESSEELINTISDMGTQLYVYPEDRDKMIGLLTKHGFLKNFEVQCRHKSGSINWGILNMHLAQDDHGNILYIEGTCQDITARKQAEKEFLESEERYQLISENMTDVICLHDSDSRYVYVSPSSETVLGYSPEEALGKSPYDFFEPEDCEQILTPSHRKVAHDKAPDVTLYKMRKKDGAYIWLETNVKPILAPDGALRYILSASRDVSERKLIEDLLQESEKKYRQLVENINKGIFVAQDGRLKFVNPMFLEIMGYSQHDLTALPFTEFIHPDDRNMVFERHARRIKGEKFSTRYEFRILTSNGKIRWLELDSVMMQWESKPAVLAFVSDITDRKQTEEELEQYRNHLEHLVEERTGQLKSSENKYRTLFENSNDSILLMKNGIIVECNAKALELFRDIREKFIGLSPDRLSPPVQPDGSNSREKSIEKNEAAASGIPQRFEWQLYKRDGTIFDAEINLHAIEIEKEIFIQVITHDISERKLAEKVLKEKEKELMTKATALEELNTALKILLQQKTKDEKELEERFASNVTKLVLPYIEKMKKGLLDSEQSSYLSIIELNLNEIVSPFLHSIKQLNFTQREAQVASLVKNGKSTKEISIILGVATSAVDTYRNNIRSKLNLNNKKTNLRTYLQSLK